MTRHRMFEPQIKNGVVVGYDGSTLGRRALAWGLREAEAHGWPLHVVRAWTISSALAEVDAPIGVVPSIDECADAVRADTQRTVTEIRGAVAAPDGGTEGEVHLHVVHGHPGEVLVAAAEGADVVVIGHRGHNLLALVLGSVAKHVLEHANCPVVVLPVPR